MDKYLNLKIRTSDFSSGPVNSFVTGPVGPVATKFLTERLKWVTKKELVMTAFSVPKQLSLLHWLVLSVLMAIVNLSVA